MWRRDRGHGLSVPDVRRRLESHSRARVLPRALGRRESCPPGRLGLAATLTRSPIAPTRHGCNCADVAGAERRWGAQGHGPPRYATAHSAPRRRSPALDVTLVTGAAPELLRSRELAVDLGQSGFERGRSAVRTHGRNLLRPGRRGGRARPTVAGVQLRGGRARCAFLRRVAHGIVQLCVKPDVDYDPRHNGAATWGSILGAREEPSCARLTR